MYRAPSVDDGVQPPLRPLSILFIEHSPADIELCLEELRRAEMEVRADVVATPEELKARLAAGAYDVILADYNLPGWTGLDALEILSGSGRPIPFILVTGSLGDEAAVDTIKQGAADYVLKDHLARLPVAVRRAVEGRRAHERAIRAAAAERRAVQLFEAFMRHSPVVAFIKDSRGRYLYVNRMWERALGRSPAEVIGRTDAELWPPEVARQLAANDRAVLLENHPCEILELVPADTSASGPSGATGHGSTPALQPWLVFKFPIEDEDGRRLLGAVGMDISERVRGEQERRNLLRELGKRVKELTVLHRTARLLQAAPGSDPGPRDELIGRVARLLPGGFCFPELAEAAIEFDGRRQATAGFAETEWRLAADFAAAGGKTGRIEVVYRAAPPHPEGEGATVFLAEEQALIQSVAEMLEAHFEWIAAGDALHQSEQKFARAFRSSPDAISISALDDGRYIDVNESFLRLSGLTRAEVVGRTSVELGLWTDEATRLEFLRRLKADGRIENWEVQFRVRGGESRITLLSAERVDVAGAPAVLAIARDVTDRRQLEQQLATAQKFEAIGQLAGGIAHDFNNVLGAILGWAELALNQAAADHPLRPHLEKIRDQGDRAAGLIRQLLAFARRQHISPRDVELNPIVGEVLRLLETVIGSGIEVRTDLAPDLLVTRADPTQVEQILINLCINARDAMPDGGTLTICTRNAEFDQRYFARHPYVRPGRFSLIEVSDTGSGMDSATLDRIFEPFFTTKQQGKGTGLGLATVYGIVKQHDGFVHVFSEPGDGATFRVYFPVGHAAPAPAAAHGAQDLLRGGSETILLAEDHDGLRELARQTLEQLGYRVLVAADGPEAVALFRRHPTEIGLALLDIVLPRLSGPDAYRQMAAEAPGLPLLLMTGYAADAPLLGEMLSQPAPILAKPYTPESLARQVRKALDAARPAPPNQA